MNISKVSKTTVDTTRPRNVVTISLKISKATSDVVLYIL